MAAAAAGKNYRYIDPSCNNQPTSGVVYIFARVHGVWTQQQEIVNSCIYGFQFIQLERDWLSVSYPTLAFGSQFAGTIVFRREDMRPAEWKGSRLAPGGRIRMPIGCRFRSRS